MYKKNSGGGGGGGGGGWGGGGVEFFFLEKQFFLISRFMLFSTLIKIETPRPSSRPSRLVYWLNGRWFLQIPVVDRDSWNLYPLYTLILYLKCGGGFGRGGGGCNVFLTFYAISNISRKKFWEYKTIISHLMFSSCFFCMLEILKSAPSLTATG